MFKNALELYQTGQLDKAATLLRALARTANPDGALLKFDEFLAGLPAGVQLFSLFHANPALLDLLAEVMGGAPGLAEVLSRNPALLDGVLDADFLAGPPSRAELEKSLDAALSQARDFEDVLDISRRWCNDRKFQMGVQILRDITDADAAGPCLTDIAETALRRLYVAVEEAFARRHGRIAGGEMVILGLGKLGGRELTPRSDLDLVFVFDCPADSEGSDGPKPLTPGHYHARLGQSLISAVTAPTGEGRLYEVDTRLRPFGRSGALVPSLQGFADYLAKEAWTWEHMALTRARPICGPDGLRARVADAIAAAVRRPRDPDRLVADIAAMRARVEGHKRADSPWDIKMMRGGLVDIEFLTQYLILRHAAAHPEILAPNTVTALARIKAAGLLPGDEADELIAATRLWRRLQGMLRLGLGDRVPDETAMPEGLRRLLVRAGRAVDFAELKAHVTTVAAAVHARFVERIEDPAAAVAASEQQQERQR